jgi:4-hydroxy-4-methyl-2-oxoglutarate aldolase
MNILEYIIRNRMSTTEVADALDKAPLLDDNLKCLVPGSRAVGYVHYVNTNGGSNYHLHEQIQRVPRGDIVLIDAEGCDNLALFGELVAKYLLIYCGAAGIIARGYIRDGQAVLKEKYPIWGYGFTPRGCVNTFTYLENDKEKRDYYNQSIIVADDCGVVLIPPEKKTKEFYDRLVEMEAKEDKWFFELDHKKMNTFQIVCEEQLQ